MIFTKKQSVWAGVLMTCLMLILIVAPFNAPKAHADPLTLVLLVVATIGGVAVVVDYFDCGFNIFFYCGPSSSGDSGGGSNGGSTFGNPGYSNGGRPDNSNNGQGGSNNGQGPQACLTADANSCGIHGSGFVVNGQCNASLPPNSLCPAPVIGKTFEAKPSLVKSGGTSVLDWNVTSATACSLSGGGLSLASLPIVGNHTTNTITQKTVFTLTCIDGVGGPSASSQATVNLVPTYQEI